MDSNGGDIWDGNMSSSAELPWIFFGFQVDGVKLYIRDVETLDVEMMYKNVGVANKIEWSKDSLFILCSQNKRGIVQIHSLEYKKWKCKISEGVAGVSGARWCPDSRHILTVQNHQVCISV
eukprot:1394550-Amorphochlora_amoeboformis.AAC.1